MGFFSKFKKIWDVDSRLDKAVEEFKTAHGLVDAAPPPETPPLTAVEPVAPAQKTEAHAPEKPAPGLSADQKAAVPGWQKQLLLSLRQAEPRLSVWLALILEGVEKADDKLWERLRFLFSALETKLEDEEDERSRLFLKLSEGLEKTRQTITRRIESILTSRETIDEGFWEELEEILITADVGYEPTVKLVERLRERMRAAGSNDPAAFKAEMFKTPRRIQAATPPEVVMMVGVNGVGKTTTIGKLAHRARMQGRKVIIAAGDTFRAAAVEQLEVWAKRVDAGFFSKGAGADPAAVAYEAIDAAIAGGYDLVLLDTAGRLHTKVNLMDELKIIKRVSGKKHEGAPHRTVLVVDATTGQNAIQQTKLFNEAVDLDEIILTKLDGTAKGGIVVALASQFGIPITFVGLGEKMEDLRPFDGKDFASALLGVQGGAPAPSET